MAVPFLNSITLNKNEVQDFKVYNIGTGNPTLSSGGDIGYFWTDTATSVLKWWDGSNVRTLLDSASTTIVAADLSGGAAGSLPYQLTAGDTTFLGIGTANQVLTVNTGATAPQWTSQSNLSVGTATFLAGGAQGSIPVQSAAGTTGFLTIGAAGRILTSDGTTPVWSATIPSSSVSGLAASATTDTTNASNISSGTLGLARLSLASGQFYVGDGSNNPAATAKSSIPLSGFGAAGADVAMGGFKITGLGTPTASTDAATMGYVDSVAQGLDVKASCKVGTIANITLSGPGASIDGISLSVDDRVLVKDQSDKKENGIYLWKGAAVAMVRSPDADTVAKLVGAFTFVEQGTNADSGWVCQVDSGTIGSVDIEWTKFSQAGSYTAGNGMVLSGGVFHFAKSTAYTEGQIPFCSNTPTANRIGFSSNLFWDNGNSRLGIGTASPAATVEVKTASSAGSAYISADSTGGSFRASGHVQFYTDNAVYDTIWFKANKGSQNMRLTDDGNLGLGVTPKSWNGNYRAIQIGLAGAIFNDNFNEDLNVSSNAYYDSTDNRYEFIRTGYAQRYTQTNGGQHRWYTSTSAGNADTAITFTQAMTLDASGNLGVGATTPVQPLEINKSSSSTALTSPPVAGSTIRVRNTSNTDNAFSSLEFYNSAGLFGGSVNCQFVSQATPSNDLVFVTRGSSGGLESLRITSAGSTLSGVNGTASNPSFSRIADPNTGLYFPTGNDTLALAVGGSDAVYIDSSRNVGIGTTPGYKLDIRDNSTGLLARLSSTSTGGCSMQFVSTSTNGRTYRIGSNYVSGAGEFSIYDDTAGLERLRIKSGGQLNLVGLNSAPTGAVGDLYYNSTSNTLQYHNNSAFQQISRKYSTALAGTNTSFTVTHNFGTRDVTVQVRKSGSTYDLVYTDVQMTTENAVTVIFASSVTGSDYTVTVIG